MTHRTTGPMMTPPRPEYSMSRPLSQMPLIAIVDDDPFMREVLEISVEPLGYRTAVFASAEEYLRSGLIRNTSCLISDMQMPGMSGLELQASLASGGHRVPIIFVSAECDERIRARGLEAGAIAFLRKPFNWESLAACLEKALKGPCWALETA